MEPAPHGRRGFLESLDAGAQAFLYEKRHVLGAVAGILGLIQVDAAVVLSRTETRERETIDCLAATCVSQELAIYQVRSAGRAEALMPSLNPETEARIESMQLSERGYRRFLDNIDTSLLGYARQYPEFDPSRNGFRQDRRIQWATVHHTGMYANAGTTDYSRPVGEPDPRALIDFMAGRGDEDARPDHKCCAVQFFNDCNGKMWQFTSRTARVRHDKRNEELSIGLETEGIDENFTTKQFENIVYWLIAVTNAEALLGSAPLEEIMRGHEEVRNEWNANNPRDRQPAKQDGDTAIMHRLRIKTADLLTKHPKIKDIAVTIQ